MLEKYCNFGSIFFQLEEVKNKTDANFFYRTPNSIENLGRIINANKVDIVVQVVHHVHRTKFYFPIHKEIYYPG